MYKESILEILSNTNLWQKEKDILIGILDILEDENEQKIFWEFVTAVSDDQKIKSKLKLKKIIKKRIIKAKKILSEMNKKYLKIIEKISVLKDHIEEINLEKNFL